jgi:phage baseplate assembly protein W
MKKDIKLVYSGEDDRTKKGFAGTHTKQIRGVQTLLQKITKLLLTQIGSDLFSPSSGSNVPSYLSSSPSSVKQMTSYINLAISQIEDSIKVEQADQSLEDEERLVSLDLQTVEQLNSLDWLIEVFVKTANNDTYLVRV